MGPAMADCHCHDLQIWQGKSRHVWRPKNCIDWEASTVPLTRKLRRPISGIILDISSTKMFAAALSVMDSDLEIMFGIAESRQ